MLPKKHEMKSISVVIPNFNGRGLLERNLPSVFVALKNANLPFEVIVSDDASTDDSVAFLRDKYPEILLVTHSKNLGFSSNINSGLRMAKCDLVLALNNDVSLSAAYFERQIHHFESPNVFGVMGALFDPLTQKIADGAKLAEQSGFGVIRSTTNITWPEQVALPTFFLSGANALMERKKLEAIGYFDEVFNPFYNEDVELSLRAWRMGWKCIFEPKAIAYHECSSTIRSVASRKRVRIISLRNRFLLHDIHLEGWQRFLFWCKTGFDLSTRWTTFDWAFYKAFFNYCAMKQPAQTSRRRFKALGPLFSLYQVVHSLRKEQLRAPYQLF